MLLSLKKSKKGDEKVVEEIAKSLVDIRVRLCGEGTVDPQESTTIATEIETHELFILIIANLGRLDFESRKNVVTIYNALLRRTVKEAHPFVEHLVGHPQILLQTVSCYKESTVWQHTGMLLRESIRYEELTKLLLQPDMFYQFFELVELQNVDIAIDAFSTFKELLTKHKDIIAKFLDENYDAFFEAYTKLLNSINYVTKRQSLKLLGELLLDRTNFSVMTRYISQRSNLKLMMTLLRDKSRSIQYEAFHVFKVFVANPNKPQPISDILVQNKEKLKDFLSDFHNDKDDEQFKDEKEYLLKQIELL
uniref:Calcium-binding protein 39 n=1 Tax=Arcella intermedia TaxID=1963864 RepID=A0A6B2LA72_9EUKA